jgi:hypothetical protein
MTKKKPAPESVVDHLLGDVNIPSKRNVITDNVDLAKAIEHFMMLKAKDDARVRGITLAWFYAHKLRDCFGGPRSTDTVRTFVREVLRRDIKTGVLRD